MNYENKHRIESLAKAACPNNRKVSVIFRSKENKLSDRPNAFIVTVGKKGYTSVRQSNYWAVDTVNSCKDYSDQELAQILNTMTKDLESLRFFGYQDADDDNCAWGEDGFGFKLDGNSLNFGLYYNF